MPGTKPPTFGPTVTLWPADAGELPLVGRWEFRRVGDDLEYFDFAGHAELPSDFVMREVLETAVDDDSVIAFVERWGMLSPHGPQASLDLLPSAERGPLPKGGGWSLSVQAHYLRSLRAVTRHWLAHVSGESLRSAWTDEGFNAPKSDGGAWMWWTDYVNAGLSRFQMHIVVTRGDHTSRGWDLAVEPTLYEVAMRQLATLASDGEEIRHCANATCRKPFTRQRGRAQYAARERGVKYCSHLCAKAQSERERRARRKAER